MLPFVGIGHRRLVGHAAVDDRPAVPDRQLEDRRDGRGRADQIGQAPLGGRARRIDERRIDTGQLGPDEVRRRAQVQIRLVDRRGQRARNVRTAGQVRGRMRDEDLIRAASAISVWA